MRHPAENFIRYLIIKGRADKMAAVGNVIDLTPTGAVAATSDVPNSEIFKSMDVWGMLLPEEAYLKELRESIPAPPLSFDPSNKMHRPSMQYLRDQQVYEMFFKTEAVEEAWDILAEQAKRQIVEQILLARSVGKGLIQKVNQNNDIHLTEEGVRKFGHYFWNVGLLTFDQWGKYLVHRSSLHHDYMALLRGSRELLLFKLRITQNLESKAMVKRAQEICYHTMEQVNLMPGTDSEKVKSIGVLTKSIVDCDTALSASDAALGAVLKQFEKFRTEHPQLPPADITKLAPDGSFTGGAKDASLDEKAKLQ